MAKFPSKLRMKIEKRLISNSLRSLRLQSSLVDFSSNDYLGLSRSEDIFNGAHELLLNMNMKVNGATGSRLLSGNHMLYQLAEKEIAEFHRVEEALIYNSGYDANVGFFSSVPQRGDLILYDELIHASIRDGIMISNAKAYKFRHNDLDDLRHKLIEFRNSPAFNSETEIYVVTESVFSMDGDTPELVKLCGIINDFEARLIVDEAHAFGVFGECGHGLIQHYSLEKEVFARLVTFGKALGCHGAAILCDTELKSYLVNYSRSLIYTTALPPHSLAVILSAYKYLAENRNAAIQLQKNIVWFTEEIQKYPGLNFIKSESAIHCCLAEGNEKVKMVAESLQLNGFDVRPIMAPTVPEGYERLRFCLHSYNSPQEISEVLKLLVNSLP